MYEHPSIYVYVYNIVRPALGCLKVQENRHRAKAKNFPPRRGTHQGCRTCSTCSLAPPPSTSPWDPGVCPRPVLSVMGLLVGDFLLYLLQVPQYTHQYSSPKSRMYLWHDFTSRILQHHMGHYLTAPCIIAVLNWNFGMAPLGPSRSSKQTQSPERSRSLVVQGS